MKVHLTVMYNVTCPHSGLWHMFLTYLVAFKKEMYGHNSFSLCQALCLVQILVIMIC